MRTIKAIREEKASLCDEAEALVLLAEKENRANTAEEQATIDGIVGKGKKGTAEYVPGKVAALEAEEARVENFNSIKAGLAERRSVDVQADKAAKNDSDGRLSRVVIPTAARYRHASLKAFNKAFDSQEADRAAYLTGQFLLATVGKSKKARAWCRENGIDTQFYGALKEGDNSLGGFLVPNEMERAIINLREERGVARRNVRVIPMGSDSMSIPRRTGGVTAYFVGENTEITASDPTWDDINLSAKKLGALVKMSSEISEDAVISLADYVVTEIAYAFADKEDQCTFNGDGTSTYGGMTGIKSALAAGSKVTAVTGNTSFDTLDLADFHSMVAKLPLYAQMNAKWYISKAGWAASMERLMAAGGGNTIGTIAAGAPPKFLGYDVVFVQVMNSTLGAQTSTDGLVYLGDLSQGVTMGSRRGVSLRTSEDRYFELDQIGIKGTERFDVVVHEKGTASVAGSIIGLSTPGS